MSYESSALLVAAASIGFLHTLLGPDHYLPFIVMSKSGDWSLKKTTWVTFLCGLGHVMSSVILGTIGVMFGFAVTRLESAESFRGNIASWLLIIFGFVYLVWGLRQAYLNKPHCHFHSHENGVNHNHTHGHDSPHVHFHARKEGRDVTPWILFTIFIFGPCEPLIPLFMYPAAKGDLTGLIFVTTVFAAVTILTMMGIVLFSFLGINMLPVSKLERHTHALAGGTILLCGMAIRFLGL